MQENTITLTQYMQQMEDKMREFLRSHSNLEKNHPAKKAADAVIKMSIEGKKLESAGYKIAWVGPVVEANVKTLSVDIGDINSKTENRIPIKNNDPVYKDFVKTYLLGLREFSKIKSTVGLIQNGGLGKLGITQQKSLVQSDIEAIETRYPEFSESASDEKVIGPESPESAERFSADQTPLEQPSMNVDPIQEEKSPDPVPVEQKHPEVLGRDEIDELDNFACFETEFVEELSKIQRNIESSFQTIESLNSEIKKFTEESNNLEGEISSMGFLERKMDKFKGDKSLTNGKKIGECKIKLEMSRKNYEFSVFIYAEYQNLKKELDKKYREERAAHIERMQQIKQRKQQEEKRAREIPAPAPAPIPTPTVVDDEQIVKAVTAKIKNWENLDKTSKEKTEIVMADALQRFNPILTNKKEEIINAIVNQVQKALYPKTFGNRYGIYLASHGCTARMFGIFSGGETLSGKSLKKAIEAAVVDNHSRSIVAAQSVVN